MEGRVIDHLEFQVDADLLELRLNDLHGVEHAGQRSLDHRQLEAVGITGIGQQLLRLCGVVWIERCVLVSAEIIVRNDRHGLARGQRALELHQFGPIHTVGDRLPDAQIVERLLGDVEIDVGELARTEHVDDRARQRFHALNPGLVLAAVDQIDLARRVGEVAGCVRGDVAIDDAVDLRRATEITLVRRVLLDRERSGADGLGAEVVTKLLHRFPADDVAALVVGEDAQNAGWSPLELDLDRGGIRRIDRSHVGVVRGERRDLGIARPFQREDDVIGGQLAVAVVALDALAQVESPGELILGSVPALRQIGLDRFRVHRARLEADQAVEHPADNRLVGRCRGAMWIKRS